MSLHNSRLYACVSVCVLVCALLLPLHVWWLLAAAAVLCTATAVAVVVTLCVRHRPLLEQLQTQVRRSRWPAPGTGLWARAAAGAGRTCREQWTASSGGGGGGGWDGDSDWCYTGSSAVDRQLHLLLQTVLRHYVLPWYAAYVSPVDRQFVGAVHALMRAALVNVARRVKDVDWLSFVTGRVVDTVVQHLRLYRRARDALGADCDGAPAAAASRRTGSTTKSTTASAADNAAAADDDDDECVGKCDALEAQFFQLEALEETGGGVSRRSVCTDARRQRRYLRDMARMVLHKLLPEQEMACAAVQTVVVEVTSQLLLLPLLQLVTSADYANSLLLWCCSLAAAGTGGTGGGGAGEAASAAVDGGSGACSLLTTDALRVVLLWCQCCDELTAVRRTLSQEMARLRARDTGGEHNDQVKDRMSSLAYLERLIEARMQQLNASRVCGTLDGAAAAAEAAAAAATTSVASRSVGERPRSAAAVLSSLSPSQAVTLLPLSTALRNNLALSYFLDFLVESDHQHLLLFYLSMEAWRLAARQQLQRSQQHQQQQQAKEEQQQAEEEELRQAAQSVFDQALSPPAAAAASEAAMPLSLTLDVQLVQRLAHRLLHERPVAVTWFDEAMAAVAVSLAAPPLYPAFQRTAAYRQLLVELELLGGGGGGGGGGDDDDDSHSTSSGDVIMSTCDQSTALRPAAQSSTQPSPPPPSAALSSGVVAAAPAELAAATTLGAAAVSVASNDPSCGGADRLRSWSHVSCVKTQVVVSGVACETGHTYTLYSVTVSVVGGDAAAGGGGGQSVPGVSQPPPSPVVWTVLRRYSDFHQFRERVVARYAPLARLPFPGKRAFNNQNHTFVERRRAALAAFLGRLLEPRVLAQHAGLLQMALVFLSVDSGGGGGGGQVAAGGAAGLAGRAVTTLRQSSLRVVGGLSRAILRPEPSQLVPAADSVRSQQHAPPHSSHHDQQLQQQEQHRRQPRVARAPRRDPADLDGDVESTSPLRIVLLLLDEVFQLGAQNQWLRRRVVAILRQLLRAMYGDSVSRRIVDSLGELTRADRVAHYVRLVRHALFPQQPLAPSGVAPGSGGGGERDAATCCRTRLVARAALLSSVGDELRHLVGGETVRRGVFVVCELLQRPALNCRLLVALFEGVLELLLPECDVARYVALAHSDSPAATATV